MEGKKDKFKLGRIVNWDIQVNASNEMFYIWEKSSKEGSLLEIHNNSKKTMENDVIAQSHFYSDK